MNASIFLNVSLGGIYLYVGSVKVFRISNLMVEGDCVVTISWLFQGEFGSMKMGPRSNKDLRSS